jgi:uncharacterized protein YndB with AHSA1/START domain
MKTSACSVIAVTLLAVVTALAPPPALAQAGPTTVPAATIDDFSWLAGHWRGRLKSGLVAEISYSKPAGGLMMAMFRLMEGEKLLVLEFMTLRETPEGMEMRARHFDPALTPWEKEEAIVLRLTEHDGLRSVFENPVHARPKRSAITLTSENSHTVRSEIINDKGEASVIEVAWERVEGPEAAAQPPAVQATPAAPEKPLVPLAHLVGGQWRGELKLLDGTVIRARHVFEWGLGGTILKSKTYGAVGDGAERLVYEGFYGWDAAKNAIVFQEFSAFGSVNQGALVPEGNELHYSWTESSRRGATEYRETLSFPDKDHYTSEGERKGKNGWEKFVTSSFRREAIPDAATAERRLRKQVTVAAPLEAVWTAWTTTEGVKTFFGPEAKVEAVVGGPFEIYFGPSQPEGLRGSEGCKVHSMVPMKLFAFTWNAPPTIPAIRNSGVHTVVYIELEESGPGETRVTMTHVGWGAGEDWDKTYQYFDRAWDAVLGNLQYRFAVGPVEWPGRFIRAEMPASAPK